MLLPSNLPHIGQRVGQRPPPLRRIHVSFSPFMIATVRPQFRSIYETMPNRVVVNIVQMSPHIFVVADNVIPKAFLPKTHRSRYAYRSLVLLGEVSLQRMHDCAEITLSCRADEQMKMVWEKDETEHDERILFFDPMQNLTQKLQVLLVGKDRCASVDYLGDENHTVGNVVTSDIAHGNVALVHTTPANPVFPEGCRPLCGCKPHLLLFLTPDLPPARKQSSGWGW